MTNREQEFPDQAQRLADLEAALDAYGADRSRWPAPVRLGLSAFIAASEAAQLKVREAEAFDRLLDAAPSLSAERIDALAARIGALAERQPRVAHQSDVQVGQRSQPAGFGRRDRGWAAAALAASLALGVFASQMPGIDQASSALIAGVSNDDGSSQQLALTDDGEGLTDEDLL
ncbi:MAG: hypothetical protein ACKVP4_04655 [Hyphomicrobium sp.]